CQLCSDAGFGETGVFGGKSDLVDADSAAFVRSKKVFEALRECACLGASLHEGSDEIGELVAFDAGGEADACDACGGEQVSETALGRGGLEGYPVEEEL